MHDNMTIIIVMSISLLAINITCTRLVGLISYLVFVHSDFIWPRSVQRYHLVPIESIYTHPIRLSSWHVKYSDITKCKHMHKEHQLEYKLGQGSIKSEVHYEPACMWPRSSL